MKPPKKLMDEWNKKLKDSGFKDIEHHGKLQKKGIDWRNYDGDNEKFSRKRAQYSEYHWVLEVNAYNNNKIPFDKRRLIIRHLDTLGDRKAHVDFRASLPMKGLLFYEFLQRRKKMMLEFARGFNEE